MEALLIHLESLADQTLVWLITASWQLALLISLVALTVGCLPNASPRLRYGLWLLVLVKVFLPTSLSADWAIGHWGIEPLSNRVKVATGFGIEELGLNSGTDQVYGKRIESKPKLGPSGELDAGYTVRPLMIVWAAGVVGFLGLVLVGYWRLRCKYGALQSIDEGPIRVALEQAALSLNLQDEQATPEVYVVEESIAPFLFGVFKPQIVLPSRLVDRLSAEQLRSVFAHELVHWQRFDLVIGWLQVVAQSLFWFHPLVWWAFAKLRHERECVCDEAVLRADTCDPVAYSETLILTLTSALGTPAPGSRVLVGVFEQGSQLQQRLEKVMSYQVEKRRYGWVSRMALLAFASVALPMASQGQSASKTAASKATSNEVNSDDESRTPYPVIVETSPDLGASDVAPSTDEIRVTFDRDMGKGMSWTGGGEDFPTVDKSRQAKWIDARTCVLPVKLERAKFYRVGINAKSFQNFKSKQGQPAAHSAVYFATKGARRSALRKLKKPEIVEMSPANGALDVDPSMTTISIKFDTPMGGGMSWAKAGGWFPGSKNGQAWWSKDGRTCTLPVDLVPNGDYRLALNGSHFINFQSKWGVPFDPVIWTFSTAEAE